MMGEVVYCIMFEVWVLYYMGSALLVIIHILRTQKWAGGHTVPSRYGCVCEFIQLYRWNNYIYVNVIIYIYTNTPVVVCCHNNEI